MAKKNSTQPNQASQNVNQNYADGIKRTGYPLEYKVTKQLNQLGWTTINSRYYEDKLGISREIDIIAYKAVKRGGIAFYTCLIVSCKKNEKEAWAFLTMDLNPEDPNIDMYPIKNWTNHPNLKKMFNHNSWKKKLIEKIKGRKYLYHLYNQDSTIFAFQQMNKVSKSPCNDKDIYNSITSLINAFEYEFNGVMKRKSEYSFYNFNLLSVAETEFVNLYFKDNDNIKEFSIDSINYLNRHIVGGRDDFYNINFCNLNHLDKQLKDYSKLHDWNVTFYTYLKNYFYHLLKINPELLNSHFKKTKKHLYKLICHNIWDEAKNTIYFQLSDLFGIHWNEKEKQYKIEINFLKDIELFQNDDINESTREWLMEYYHYKGKFEYFIEYPF